MLGVIARQRVAQEIKRGPSRQHPQGTVVADLEGSLTPREETPRDVLQCFFADSVPAAMCHDKAEGRFAQPRIFRHWMRSRERVP
jgi:hypothetical protein